VRNANLKWPLVGAPAAANPSKQPGLWGACWGLARGREPIRRRRQWPQRPPASRLPCMADGRCDQDGRQSGGSCTSIGAQAAYPHGPTHPGKQLIELIDSRYNLSSINRIQSVKTMQVAAFAHLPPRRSACACGHDLLDLSGPSGPCRLAMPARTNAAMFRYSVNRRCAVRATARALTCARLCESEVCSAACACTITTLVHTTRP
jgi:hypothetical protein